MKKVLSIIIPTFNMEGYLSRCLESLIIQEDLEMLEVWIVNDGSTDKSSEIAHKYSKEYPGIFNVLDKSNGNYGSCINAVLSICTGLYVKILDSDDYFDTEQLQKLMKQLQNCNCDAVLTDYTTVYSNHREKKSFPYKDNCTLTIDIECPQYFPMHCICYKTSLFSRFNYKQTEGIPHTDIEWIFYPMIFVERLIYFPLNIYQYEMGRLGQTMEQKTFIKNAHFVAKILIRMISFIKGKEFSYKRKDFLNRLIKIHSTIVYESELILNHQKDYHKDILIKLDNSLKGYDQILYKTIESTQSYTFNTITYFRKHRRRLNPILVRFCMRFYSLLHLLKLR